MNLFHIEVEFLTSFILLLPCQEFVNGHPLSRHVARFSEVTVVENRLMPLGLPYLLIYVGFGH